MTTRDAQALRFAFVQRPHVVLMCIALAACSTAPHPKSQTPTASAPAASEVSPHTANPAPPAPAAAPATSPPPSPPPPETHAALTPGKGSSPASTGTKKTPGAKKPAELPTPPAKDAAVTNEKLKPAPATTVAGGKLSGRIDLVAGTGQQLSAADLTDTTIYFVPSAGAPHPKPGRFNIYTREKQFDPATLVIPVGSTVSFPNKDQILHNVFSITSGATFDLGLYGEGGSAEYTFKTPGLALINCNVHQAMQANVLVLDTPYFGHPDKDGQFQLDVPAGAGSLMVWHPRAAIQTKLIAAATADPLTLRLVLTKPRVVQHLNKERKVY